MYVCIYVSSYVCMYVCTYGQSPGMFNKQTNTHTHTQVNLLGRVLHVCPRSALIPPDSDFSAAKIWMETVRYSNTSPRALEPSFFFLDSSRRVIEIIVPIIHLPSWTEMLLSSQGSCASISHLAVAASRRPSTAHTDNNATYIHSDRNGGMTLTPSALVLEVTHWSKFAKVEDAVVVRNVPVRSSHVVLLQDLLQGKTQVLRANMIVKVRIFVWKFFVAAIYAYVCVFIYIYIYIYIHTHTYIHTYICYIHRYICLLLLR
jgi:hypothetical protein